MNNYTPSPEQVAYSILSALVTAGFIAVIIALVAIGLFMAWYAPEWTPLEALR